MKLTFLLSLALSTAACSSPPRHVDLSSWGELRAVLKEGETQGRVELARAAEPGTYGLGAVEGLRGEVLVLDGEVWVSRAASPEAVGPAGPPLEGEQATLLAVAQVESWSESALPAAANIALLERQVLGAVESADLDRSAPVPFIIEGTAVELELHVLNGACPFADPPPAAERAPYRAALGHTEVTLVGLYAEGAAGVLTHHGSSLHVHVLTGGPASVVGHVDGLRLLEGARLRVPKL